MTAIERGEGNTVFQRIVSAEAIFFLIWPYVLWPLSQYIKSVELFNGGNYLIRYMYTVFNSTYSFRIIAIFYFINWIVAAETIEGGKLFKGQNYLRKYGNQILSFRDGNSKTISVLGNHKVIISSDIWISNCENMKFLCNNSAKLMWHIAATKTTRSTPPTKVIYPKYCKNSN